MSTVVPVRSPFSQSRMRSRPLSTTRCPFSIELAAWIASWRNAVIVYQLVSPSIHFSWLRSNRRWVDARRNEVIGNPSLVTMCLGGVATRPVMVR
jgi:hypothetical protein